MLIFSRNGSSTVCVAVVVYFMNKFRWSLLKSLEYINSKRKGFSLPASALNKLEIYEKSMKLVRFSNGWDEMYYEGFYIE